MDQSNADSCFRPADDLELNRVPDGAMVYQKSRERVHFLNTTALVVFELCGAGKKRAEIEAFVADAFGLSDAPTQEIEECLKSMLDEGLVEAVPCSQSSAGR